MTYPTTEQVEKARQASLADFFIQNGYDTERSRNELHIKGYGGLFVNIETNEWYCFSQENKHGGRNAINCLTDIIGMDFKTAVEALTGQNFSQIEYHTSERTEPKKKELVLPERADNMRKVFAYLCNERMLDCKIVSELAHDGLLYQDTHGNAVFLHKDENGNNVGAEIQGTNSQKRYKGVAAGTSDSLFVVKIGDTMSQGESQKCGTDAAHQKLSHKEPTRSYIFESAIDLLSFKQIAKPQRIQNCMLVSMAGLKPNTLNKLVDSGMELLACVDNDTAGKNFIKSNNLVSRNHILSEHGVKDFNELLQKMKGKQPKIEKPPPMKKRSRH